MYETPKCPAIMTDATSCRSKIQNGSQLTGSSNSSETMTHIIKIPTATTMFSGQAYSSGISDFVGRRCVPEIQYGSRITGSSNNFAVFMYRSTCRSKTNTGVYDYVRNI